MIFRNIVASAILALALAGFSPAHAAEGFTAAQKEELQGIIKDYIFAHPQEIMDAVQQYQEKKQQDVLAESAKKIPEYKEFLESKDNPSIGPKDAKVTVIEFFDFNCGYCKQAYADIAKLRKEHKEVRFVFKELPILSPTSKLASEWALAAHRQGKYFEYHAALMGHKGAYDEALMKKIGADLKLDVEKLAKDAADPAIAAELDKNQQVANDIGIRGTPGFIVNGKSYPGYIGEDGMKNAIKDAGG
ncbi:MAG: DsbA family protein [Alphaproteobacteria bacterium]